MRLGIGGVSSSSETLEIFQLPQAMLEALAIFFAADREKGIKIFQEAKIRLSPTDKFLQSPARCVFKRLILKTPLCRHLLLAMSSTLVTELTDQE